MQIKKTAAVFLAAIIILLMTSCGKDHMDASVYTEAQSMAEASYSSSKTYKWGTGDFSVGDYLFVTYEITNLSSQRAREITMQETAITSDTSYIALKNNALDIIKSNLKNQPLSLQLFDIIKSPSGGSTSFTIACGNSACRYYLRYGCSFRRRENQVYRVD